MDLQVKKELVECNYKEVKLGNLTNHVMKDIAQNPSAVEVKASYLNEKSKLL